MTSSIPAELKKKGNKEFWITWEDGHESRFSGAALRRACRCAACENERTGERMIKDSDISDDVEILKADMTGNYALSFKFSDGHQTGIYAFDTLRAICPCCKKGGG